MIVDRDVNQSGLKVILASIQPVLLSGAAVQTLLLGV